MPPEMAYCRLRGMAAMMSLRMLVTVIRMFMIPQMNTMDSACCQVNPIWPHTVTTKNEHIPSPGARANGTLAYSDITSVPTTDAITAARNTAPHSMPDWERMFGATMMM